MDKGSIIKRLREKRGFSQVELADMIGVSKQTLYKYEKNIVTNIPSDKIEALAKALGTAPEVIMGWTEPPKMVFTAMLPPESQTKELVEEYENREFRKELSRRINESYKNQTTTQEYYIDAETRALAQELHDNPELSIMLNAYRTLSPRDAKLVMDMVKRMQDEDNS